jgi:prolipoprotein diacylglyceryl transferase
MLPFVHIGPLTIPTPGLIMIVGLWIGLSLSEKYSNKHGLTANNLYNLVFISIVAGIITARIVYILQFPSPFLTDPLSSFLPNPNMLDLPGGLAGCMIASMIYIQQKKLGVWQTLDALTPMFAVLAVSIPLSNLASGDGYGSPSNLPWAFELWGTRRHPSQIYELLAASFILIGFWPSRFWIHQLRPGGYFLMFLVATSTCKLVLEAFRGDSLLILQHYRGTQVFALVILLISLWGLRKRLPQDIDSASSNDNG